MAILVKHNKVSTVPDTSDTSLVRPSDWNADHTLTGFGTAAELDAGVANGVATLDGSGKVPTSQIPLQGDLNYQGAWNASTNTPTLASGTGTKGYYYVVSVAGTTNLDGITDWQVGDWAIFNGTVWQKVDNTDAVTSVNGYTGAVVLTQPDIAGTVPTTRTISTGTGLTGGGDLSANRTISFSDSNVATWAATPSSANLRAAVTDETGTGSLVFNTSPSLSSPTIDGANPYINFADGTSVALAAGRMWYNGTTGSLNFGMGNGNITQQVGEEIFVYGKATAAITEGQVIVKTGAVGASGVITFAPAGVGITDDQAIIGIATENIALNGFGRVTAFGVVHGIDTSAFTDGDIVYYDPATGGLTATKPTAPNVKCEMGIVINAGSGGSGSIQVEIIHGTSLGGTDSNVNISSPTGGNLLSYDQTAGYWKNINLTDGTGISVTEATNGAITVTNTAPDQVVSISGGGTTTVTGTYPNFTVSSDDQYDGTVTSVDLTAGTGISVSGGPITTAGSITVTNTAPDQTVVLNAGTGISTSGTYPNFTVTNTAPDQTVSISAGTGISVSGTYPNFTVTNTSPDVPFTYTSTYVPYGQGTTTPDQSADFTYDESVKTLTAPQVRASNGIMVNSATVSADYSIPSGSNAMSAGPISIASGITVTVPSGNAWVIV